MEPQRNNSKVTPATDEVKLRVCNNMINFVCSGLFDMSNCNKSKGGEGDGGITTEHPEQHHVATIVSEPQLDAAIKPHVEAIENMQDDADNSFDRLTTGGLTGMVTEFTLHNSPNPFMYNAQAFANDSHMFESNAAGENFDEWFGIPKDPNFLEAILGEVGTDKPDKSPQCNTLIGNPEVLVESLLRHDNAHGRSDANSSVDNLEQWFGLPSEPHLLEAILGEVSESTEVMLDATAVPGNQEGLLQVILGQKRQKKADKLNSTGDATGHPKRKDK